MEMGSWALFQSPSLLALIPLLVCLIIIFKGKSTSAGIIVGIAIGAVMMGQDLKMLSKAFAESLSSSTALIGVIIMAGAGLGVLMTETGASRTLVYWIVKCIGVNTQAKAKLTLIICSVLVCGLLGTLGGGNAVIAPVLIPVMASLGVTPSVVGALFKVAGEVGLIAGPLTGVTLMTMEITGLSYGELMLKAVIPFSAVWLISMWFATKRTQRRTEGKEKYELDPSLADFDSIVISAKEKRTTAAFLIAFVLLVGYGVVSKQGTSYALIVMILLSAVLAIASRMDIDDAIKYMCKGVASQSSIFVIFITINVLLEMTSAGGGFEALGNLLSGVSGNNPSVIMLIAAVVGGFGIEAAAVAEIQIIGEMFMDAAIATGLPMSMFAISILSATRMTGSMYPTANMMGQLGIARCENTKEVLEANWISCAAVWVFVVIWAFVGVMIL